jgi:hypothetical protein
VWDSNSSKFWPSAKNATCHLTVEISSISLSFSLSKNPGSLGDGSNAVDDLAKDIVSYAVQSLLIDHWQSRKRTRPKYHVASETVGR